MPYGHGLHNPYTTPQAGLPRTWVSQGPSRRGLPQRRGRCLGADHDGPPDQLHADGRSARHQRSGGRRGRQHRTRRTVPAPSPTGTQPERGDRRSAAGPAPRPPGPPAGRRRRHRLRLVPRVPTCPCRGFRAGPRGGLRPERQRSPPLWPPSWPTCAPALLEPSSPSRPMPPRWRCSTTTNPFPTRPRSSTAPRPRVATPTWSAPGCGPTRRAPPPRDSVVLGALNDAVAEAVRDARADHVTNVTLVDVAHTMDGHGVCTADPWVFSGEPVPDSTLTADAGAILSATPATASRLSAFPVRRSRRPRHGPKRASRAPSGVPSTRTRPGSEPWPGSWNADFPAGSDAPVSRWRHARTPRRWRRRRVPHPRAGDERAPTPPPPRQPPRRPRPPGPGSRHRRRRRRACRSKP